MGRLGVRVGVRVRQEGGVVGGWGGGSSTGASAGMTPRSASSISVPSTSVASTISSNSDGRRAKT